MVASSFPKARRFARTPVLFASVQIGNEAQGLILNGSEGGICVQITNGSVGPGLVDLQFQSAAPGHTAAWVGCRGRVIWKSEDRTVAGIEFVDSTPLTNREIKNWLSFGQSLRELRREWPAEEASQSHWADHISDPGSPPPAFPVEASQGEVGPLENPAPESEPEQPRPRLAAFGQNYEDAMPRVRALRITATALIVLVGAVVLMRLHGTRLEFPKYCLENGAIKSISRDGPCHRACYGCWHSHSAANCAAARQFAHRWFGSTAGSNSSWRAGPHLECIDKFGLDASGGRDDR